MDVDYFFKEGKGQIHGAEVMVSEDEIRTLLDLQEGLMSHVPGRCEE